MSNSESNSKRKSKQGSLSVLALKRLRVIVVQAQVLVMTQVVAGRVAGVRMQPVAEVAELLMTVRQLIAA